jgi:hypothetical protein
MPRPRTQRGGLQVLHTHGHTDVDDQRMMVEIAGGATLSLVYENLLKEAVPNFTENSVVILIVCGGILHSKVF